MVLSLVKAAVDTCTGSYERIRSSLIGGKLLSENLVLKVYRPCLRFDAYLPEHRTSEALADNVLSLELNDMRVIIRNELLSA